jgi:hypothetical protein
VIDSNRVRRLTGGLQFCDAPLILAEQFQSSDHRT